MGSTPTPGTMRFVKVKRDVMLNYGGVRCYCCGETELGFLTIDHSFQDGENHKKNRGKGASNLYYWLKRNHYPQNLGLRVACANCNTATMFGRICPHKNRMNESTLVTEK